MKDTLDIKKELLQSLIGTLKDAESDGIKNRPVKATMIVAKKPTDCEEGSGEPVDYDLDDEDTLAELKKLFGA